MEVFSLFFFFKEMQRNSSPGAEELEMYTKAAELWNSQVTPVL